MDDKTFNDREKPLILIVDDEPKNLQVLGNMLRERDYNVSAAANGRQALEMTDRFRPDLILLDIIMSEPDGLQVCEQLKASREKKDIPVIFLTAKTDSEDIVKGFELGAVDYITKPFNVMELMARVNTHLELRKAQKEMIKLEQKNALLAMAITANHEINQPLTVLQGNLELFRRSIDKTGLSDKQQNFLNKMEKSLARIQVILGKISNFDSVHYENYLEDKKMAVFDK
jgi:DNA-binding response OmpR family regulator